MKSTVTLTVLFAAAMLQAAIVDTVVFGESASEKSHALEEGSSRYEQGGLGEPCRILLPPVSESWQGGTMKFRVKADPRKLNYVTVKLWGGDVNENLLLLQVDGKQLGYRHLGDIDILDHGSKEPALPGRFYYVTTPIPLSATYGRGELELEIVSTGRIWGYGNTFERYQKNMTDPTRGIYRLYIHDNGCFVPPAEEKQGTPPAPATPEEAEGTFDKLKARVNRDLINWLKPDGKLISQMHMQMLARAYHIKWTRAYRHPQAAGKVAAGVDEYFLRFRKEPKLAGDDRSTYNPDWFGFGPAADAILHLREELAPYLDQKIRDEKGEEITRRAAWTEMLEAGLNYLATHRRQYTNQSMILDMNLHLNNRGLKFLDSRKGLPLEQTLGFLHESVGLKPWSGKLDDKGKSTWPQGRNYMQLSAKFLTKELGYVGNYGEVLDWTTSIYDATRPAPGEPGDEAIREVLAKMIRARSYFRYPSLDPEGRRVMRLETVIGWRDTAYPGDSVYAQRPNRDGSAIQAVAATLDPYGIGLAQQMFDEKQFFNSVEHQMKEGGFRVTFGLLNTPDQYELLKKQSAQPSRMPMSETEPDFVFSDEENGVLALKDGGDILYASLYWRARNAVNFLAKFHHITPAFERIATVRQEIEFEPSGLVYSRPNWTNFGFANGGPRYPVKIDSLLAGERFPIARIPEEISFRAGQENPYAGRGEFYRSSYGSYEIGMNASKNKSFEMILPEGGDYQLLGSGETRRKGGGKVTVSPMSTQVWKRLGDLSDQAKPALPVPEFGMVSASGAGVLSIVYLENGARKTASEITVTKGKTVLPSRAEVLGAFYGNGESYLDATAYVAASLDNRVSAEVSNKYLSPDPAKGKKKTLLVFYRVNSNIQILSVEEGGELEKAK